MFINKKLKFPLKAQPSL